MNTARAAGRLFVMVLVVLASAVPVPGIAERAMRTVTVEGNGSYTNVAPAGLRAMLGRKDFLLVNVHIPYAGEIEPTDRFIPFNAIGANLDKLPARKDAKVVLYCVSDRMSTIAAGTLVKLGYTNVWNLEGGMVAWQDAGYEVTHRRR